MTLTAVLDRLRQRAGSDPSLLATLEHLAVADPVEDPFSAPADDLAKLARTINRQRQTDRLTALRERSLTTGQVVELVASISDRKGVDRRRARGTLLGIRAGNQLLHPTWQFDPRRQDTFPGLPLVLAAGDVQSAVAADALDADAIATTPRVDAGGACVAQLLAAGDVQSAVALVHLAGDQS